MNNEKDSRETRLSCEFLKINAGQGARSRRIGVEEGKARKRGRERKRERRKDGGKRMDRQTRGQTVSD